MQAGCTRITNHDYEEPITGLGIMAVREIVSDHGGIISYAVEPGHDTTFRLTLPLASSQ